MSADEEWDSILKVLSNKALDRHEFIAVDTKEYNAIVLHLKELRGAFKETHESNDIGSSTLGYLKAMDVLNKSPKDYTEE